VLIDMHMRMSQGAMRKGVLAGWADSRYWYIDLNAGPGYINGEPGSPAIALDCASTYPDLPLRAHFFDQDRDAIDSLYGHFRHETWTDKVDIHEGDNRVMAANLARVLPRRKAYGLIFADPNGNMPPIEAIREILSVPNFGRYIDVLAYINATSIKRIRGAGLSDQFLLDGLQSLGKQYALIRTPSTAWQWTFVILTNWADFPVLKRHGFFAFESPEGQAIASRINYSARERQPSLL
jgi:three-Cys-motif partner protein